MSADASAIRRLPGAVEAAAARIRPHVRETPIEPAPALAGPAAAVLLKLESLQRTGSFKVRGAVNRLLTLPLEVRERGVVAASTGNHGAAVAYGAACLGVAATVFVPEEAAAEKVRSIERRGAEVRRVPGDPLRAEAAARRYAAAGGRAYVSPYNDLEVVAGQGTVGWELTRQAGDLDRVYVALGGGGLVSGIAAWMKSVRPGIEVIACSPANSPVMIESVRAGRVLELESLPTLSDGTAGGVEEGAVTFDLCRSLVDDYLTVDEERIRSVLLEVLATQRLLIEGAAAVAVAGFLATRERCAGRRVGIVVCGGNLGLDVLASLLRPPAGRR